MTRFGVQLPNFSGVETAELFEHADEVIFSLPFADAAAIGAVAEALSLR